MEEKEGMKEEVQQVKEEEDEVKVEEQKEERERLQLHCYDLHHNSISTCCRVEEV